VEMNSGQTEHGWQREFDKNIRINLNKPVNTMQVKQMLIKFCLNYNRI